MAMLSVFAMSKQGAHTQMEEVCVTAFVCVREKEREMQALWIFCSVARSSFCLRQ